MNHKVLLADDSLTIQKVIKITLANQPYEITDCSTEDQLFQQLSVTKPKLVFLDFNLSDRYSGYELTTKIKSLSPSSKVLLLLGTFDTVDENAMERCGASDKIVKPFDSNKFIAICKQLMETFADEEIPYPEEKKVKEPVLPESPDDQWTVSHSTEHKLAEPKETITNATPTLESDNPLMKEMSDWGMSVPGVINDHSGHDQQVDLPPVIAEVKSIDEQRAKNEASKYEQKFPENNDLDYPTIEELETSPTEESNEAKESAPVSKLISIDSFNDKPFDLEIEDSFVPNDADVSSIEAQIRDEVEDNLWQADEFEDLKKEVSDKIEEVKNNFQPTRNDFDESLFRPLDDNDSIDWDDSENAFGTPRPEKPVPASAFNQDEVKEQMEEMVKRYVKEYLDEMFQKNTEKIAWEVIPDLAENLIRQELSKIANKISNE
jgi:DNA-binding response OmpR family regulator